VSVESEFFFATKSDFLADCRYLASLDPVRLAEVVLFRPEAGQRIALLKRPDLPAESRLLPRFFTPWALAFGVVWPPNCVGSRYQKAEVHSKRRPRFHLLL